MKLECDIVHLTSIVHKAADALFRLRSTNGFLETIDDGIPIQCMFHYKNEPCFVDPDGGAYFDNEEDEFLKILPITSKNVQFPSVAEAVKSLKINSFCAELAAAVAEPKKISA